MTQPFDDVASALRPSPALTHPLYIATNAPDRTIYGIIAALNASFPAMDHERRIPGTFKAKPVAFRQQFQYVSPPDDSTTWLLQWATAPVDESQSKHTRLYWRGRLRQLDPGRYVDRFGQVETVVCFDVTYAWFQSGALVATPQLALTRHLLAKFYRALDPKCEIVGRHDWSPGWWPTLSEQELAGP